MLKSKINKLLKTGFYGKSLKMLKNNFMTFFIIKYNKIYNFQ